MVELIEKHLEQVRALCRRYKVRRLEVFGSATGGQFDAASSDMDFLVEFGPLQEGEYADSYFGLLEELGELFGRKVDLVMTRAIKNPYFLEQIEKDREVLYAA